jgi:hypothetical protein
MTDAPIFQNVGQALHVSYLMAILPVTQKVSTQVLIEAMREQLGKVEARIASTINMGGMSPLEFRGQCAMVTAAVQHHLPAPEYGAIRARYGHQKTKADGVLALAQYIEPRAGVSSSLALKALVWSHYHRGNQRAADRWSLRAIETECGVPVHILRKGLDIVRSTGNGLERRGETRLEALFSRTGLTPALNGLAESA